MYSLMIVDDEPIVLRAISHVVESSCPIVQVIAQTGSGTEAVFLALEKKPDIIFMDIELSGVNGLEAIAEIKKTLPEVIIVVISAYDNFQYAQKSIALGVVDYLLKPVSKDDLILILNKATGRLEDQRGKTREQMELRDKLKKMRPFLEEDLFFSLLYPSIGMHPLPEYPQLLDLKVNLGQAVEIYAEDCNLLAENFGRYKQLIRNQLNGVKDLLFSPLIGRTALILIGYESSPGDERGVWTEVFHSLRKSLNLPTTIILGQIGAGFEGMIHSFQNLRKSTQLYSYSPGVYFPEEIPASTKKEFAIPWPVEREFFEAIKSGQKELAGIIFAELFRLVSSSLTEDLQSQKDYFQGIVAVLLRIFFENASDDIKQSFRANIFWQRINRINDSNELKLIIEEIVNQLTEKIEKKGSSEKNPEIRSAIEYMNLNYFEEITLADIASAAAISPGYLSRLFKEYRDQTVMDFLEKIRIEKALKLLKETDYSIKDISLQVGYKDPNYFSKVFKKVTNSSPTTVRI